MQTAVTSSVSTASSWLYDAGKNIITGLISGIEDMAWQAAQAAIAVVRDAIDAAKGWLGISSPSRVAHELIGMPFSQGVARGILSGIGEITRAGQQASRAALAPRADRRHGGDGGAMAAARASGTSPAPTAEAVRWRRSRPA